MPRKPDQNKRTNILKAARKLFKQHGYHNTCMADIAKVAGVSNGSLYHYFGAKANLVDALYEDYVFRITAVIRTRLNNPDTREALVSAIHAAFQFAVKERDLVNMANLRATLEEPVGVLNAEIRLRAFLENWILERMEKGDLHQYNAAVASELLTGIIDYFARVALISTNLGIEHFENSLTQLIERAFIKDSGN